MTLEWTDDGAFDLGVPLDELAFATSRVEVQPGAFSTVCCDAIILQDDGDEGDIDQLDGEELDKDVDVDEEFAEDELEEEEFEEDLEDIDEDDDFSDYDDDFDEEDDDDDDF